MLYKCYVCDRTFKKPEHLGVHSVMHSAADVKPKVPEPVNETLNEDVLELLAKRLLEITKAEKPKLEKSVSDREVLYRSSKAGPSRPKFIRSFSTPIWFPPRPKQPPPLHLLKNRAKIGP